MSESKGWKKREPYFDLAVELTQEAARRGLDAMFNLCCCCKHVEFDGDVGEQYVTCCHPVEAIRDKIGDIADSLEMCDCWAFRPDGSVEKRRERALAWLDEMQAQR